jgi:hypothetical protein
MSISSSVFSKRFSITTSVKQIEELKMIHNPHWLLKEERDENYKSKGVGQLEISQVLSSALLF